MPFGDQFMIDPAYRDALRSAGLADVAAALSRTDGEVIAWSRTTATLHFPGAGTQPGFFVKRYLYPFWKHRFRSILRGTFLGRHRALVEYGLLTAMRLRGIPAVRPVACGARRRGQFVTASILITEETPGAVNLTCFACDLQDGRRRLAPRDRHAAARKLAREVAILHDSGFAHGQLFWRNVLVRPNPVDGHDFFFLDPRPLRAKQYTYRGARMTREELAQLMVSSLTFTTRTDRLRFLRAYLGEKRLTSNGKSLAREVAVLHTRWLRHENQRIRMSRVFESWRGRLHDEVLLDPPQASVGPPFAANTGIQPGPRAGAGGRR